MSRCQHQESQLVKRGLGESFQTRVPPHLEMDAYADFVAASLQQADPEKVSRQKAIEERIVTRFRVR